MAVKITYKARENYYKKQIEDAANDSKQLWNAIKEIHYTDKTTTQDHIQDRHCRTNIKCN